MAYTAALTSGILDPRGPIAAAERTMLVNATVIMLAVIVPVIVLALAFGWWFRAGNAAARRRPDWSYSGQIEVTVWSIPLLVVLFLGGIAWLGSHDLDPGRPIDPGTRPFDVQVVALDWKWLFFYPSLNAASVNRLVVPAGVPLRLHLTSATVMNSFLVPQLGSQIYAMAGMTTTLNLKADKPGIFPGLSSQFSGDGFSDMRFDVIALPRASFQAWQQAAHGLAPLDDAAYAALAKPGTQVPMVAFGSVATGMFEHLAAAGAPAAPAAAPMSQAAPATANGAQSAPAPFPTSPAASGPPPR